MTKTANNPRTESLTPNSDGSGRRCRSPSCSTTGVLGVKVRKMGDANKPRWLELRRALWPKCTPERHFLEMRQLQHSDGVVLLAEDSEGQVVGFAEISIRQDHVEGTSSAPVPYLEGWYVIPRRRRQGIGRVLIKSAESWALEAGFWELASDAESDNHNGIRAHGDLGFREVGRSVHFVRTLRAPEVGPGLHRMTAPGRTPARQRWGGRH